MTRKKEAIRPLDSEEYLERMRQLLKEGNGEGVFRALNHCFMKDIPPPTWAKDAFMEGWRRFYYGVPDDAETSGAATLGGAFNIQRPAKFDPAAERRRRMMGQAVWSYITARLSEGAKKPAVFEEAAEYFYKARFFEAYELHTDIKLSGAEKAKKPVKASTVRDLYYGYIKYLRSISNYSAE